MTTTPVYYWRYKRRYVAWFCEPDDVESFLHFGSEFNNFAVIPDGPEPGVEYEDLGHEHCMAENCPEG